MNNINNKVEIKCKKSINRIFKVSLTVTLIAFVVFTIFSLSYLQVIKPAMAAPSFIISKTLKDDAAGHSHGWNPNGNNDGFNIIDNDVSPTKFLHVIASGDPNEDPGTAICDVTIQVKQGVFVVNCRGTPADGAPLRYIIIDVPTKVVTSILPVSSSESESSPSPSPSSPFATLPVGK